ncbi:DEAD/DEAH box helicase [Nitrosococcus watsonii]|uniref:ATP-dependent RNA helicase RhlB n=1 Tax=Nitrosococcus watsoni (strain C-113) TaxID=105559 RepID=D8KAW6_NITWC|nr:DEAD/DEAH box helicase [Nitrosococcus watsonii]ADJ27500.1 DEAD/DEAH box helicase domain protein [Nitrosococcus watsonii C-113]
MTDPGFSEISFDSLNLAEALIQGIQKAGFVICTPIQALALPLLLAGEDVAGQAQTGTGKTAAFLLATMQRLLREPSVGVSQQPRGLIVVPTRELAIQVSKDAQLLGQHTDLRCVVVYGGTNYRKQRHLLEQGCDILIGTPGRLIDYYQQGIIGFKKIQTVVLDEADRMFDLGFIRDIRYILRRLPPPDKRLGMLFSATLSLRVMELAYEYMNNPRLLRIEPQKVTVDKITERIYFPANEEKISLLLALLKRLAPRHAIVFANTKHGAEQVWGYLEGNGFKAALLSSDVPQGKRQRLLTAFQDGIYPILVATDVAARGLHVSTVTHVFNYDLPQDPEDYVHRIGRTARAGASGSAVSFACEDYAFSLPDIEEYIGHKVVPFSVEEEELLVPKQRVFLSYKDKKKSRKEASYSGQKKRTFRKKETPSGGKNRT